MLLVKNVSASVKKKRPLLDFVSIGLFIISKWAPLSDGLLLFLLIEFELTGQLTGLTSVCNYP